MGIFTDLHWYGTSMWHSSLCKQNTLLFTCYKSSHLPYYPLESYPQTPIISHVFPKTRKGPRTYYIVLSVRGLNKTLPILSPLWIFLEKKSTDRTYWLLPTVSSLISCIYTSILSFASYTQTLYIPDPYKQNTLGLYYNCHTSALGIHVRGIWYEIEIYHHYFSALGFYLASLVAAINTQFQ